MKPGRTPSLHSSPRGHAAWLGVLAAMAFWLAPVCADVAKEHELKAAFLFNFTKFVDWPADRYEYPTDPIVVGILGTSPVGGAFEALVAGRSVNGRAIVVRRLSGPAESRSVHMLFVDSSMDLLLAEIDAATGGAGVLTVGETRAFAAHGGIITFTIDGERVRFEINQGSGEKAGLRISAQLLKLAKSVRRVD